MTNMETLRAWQLQILENNVRVLTHVINGISDADLTTRRDGPDGWTVREVLAHMRDFETVFIERATVTLAQDNPPLPFPDPNELAVAGNYNSLDAPAVLAEWAANRQRLLAIYRAVLTDQWERPAKHPTRGSLNLQEQLFLLAWHDTNHLAQIAKILAG